MGGVSPAIRVGNGYSFFEVAEENQPRIPAFDEVKERVRTDVLNEKAMALARSEGEKILAQIREGQDAEKVSKAAGLEVKSSESFLRTSQLPEAGRAPAVQEAVFSLELDRFSDLLPTDNGYVFLRVLERSGFSEDQLAADRSDFTEQFLNERKQQAWSAFLQELKRRYAIRIDREVMRQLTG
jgi:parvulin-like peptidyl-prolyl isomerase